MHKTKHNYWKTTDLYLAAYLYGRGPIIVGVEAITTKAVFSFIDSPERQEWHEEFVAGTPTMDVRIFICAIQTLRQKRLDALMQSNGTRS